ncbi:hypothetical protein GOC74_00185 [Halomicrobium mukohataei]|uniref:Uncharacterized protein n=1 Tax=Halomicrobium mukohataei TaxID=57705 RepID=A0A847TQP7_9EURY|nr:hypothetical protein [Halomicrobium mukohataei]NLV08362.1 hypothetical protein [Halomicrobium mukohataei]
MANADTNVIGKTKIYKIVALKITPDIICSGLGYNINIQLDIGKTDDLNPKKQICTARILITIPVTPPKYEKSETSLNLQSIRADNPSNIAKRTVEFRIKPNIDSL